jgi:hypothetical protein
VLVVIAVLNLRKPPGLTRYGQRQRAAASAQREPQGRADSTAGSTGGAGVQQPRLSSLKEILRKFRPST